MCHQIQYHQAKCPNVTLHNCIMLLTSAKPMAHSLSFMKFLGSVSLVSTFLTILTYSSSLAGKTTSTFSSEIRLSESESEWFKLNSNLVFQSFSELCMSCLPRPTCHLWPAHKSVSPRSLGGCEPPLTLSHKDNI